MFTPLSAVDGMPRIGLWSTTTRYTLTAGAEGVLRARDLPRLHVARPGDQVAVVLNGVEHFDGTAAAIVGRHLARASSVDVLGGRPRVCAAFRDLAQDAALQLLRVGGAA